MNKPFEPYVIVFDVDGVFTDGKTWQDSSGEWRRSFSVRDTMGVRALRKAGYRVLILAAADSTEIKTHFENVGVDVYKGQCADPDAAAEAILRSYGLKNEHAAFVKEDGSGSLRLMVNGHAVYTTARHGGDGAVFEICNLILQHSRHVLNQTAQVGEL